MASLYDMTRRLTKHQIDDCTKKLEEEEEQPAVTIDDIIVSHCCPVL